jgi:hypothetical protein
VCVGVGVRVRVGRRERRTEEDEERKKKWGRRQCVTRRRGREGRKGE